MKTPTEAIENLTNCQRQLDRDGIEVGVSRQALCMTLKWVNWANPDKTPEDDDPLSRHWRPQCLVARIQRDESIKSAQSAKASKRVMKNENLSLRRRLVSAIAVIVAIEERFTDGCDTCDDYKFMGSTARDFLDSIRGH